MARPSLHYSVFILMCLFSHLNSGIYLHVFVCVCVCVCLCVCVCVCVSYNFTTTPAKFATWAARYYLFVPLQCFPKCTQHLCCWNMTPTAAFVFICIYHIYLLLLLLFCFVFFSRRMERTGEGWRGLCFISPYISISHIYLNELSKPQQQSLCLTQTANS